MKLYTMNTKRLVVGQDVRMVNDLCVGKGKVVKVTSWGVEVQEYFAIGPDEWELSYKMLYFDTRGRQCHADGKPEVDDGKIYWDPWSWEESGRLGTYERGPWRIEEEQRIIGPKVHVQK